jgi:regulatory protein spx
MITLITNSSCSSSRRACEWLKEYNIDYVEKRINEITFEELKKILSLTDRGTIDLEVRESPSAKEKGEWRSINRTINEAPSLKVLFYLIHSHPQHFKTPIIFTENKLSIGFNDNDFRAFIPREKRRLIREAAMS